MARPRKAVVDYFPLVCKWGDSMEFIEDTYGNDGFICWVKLLQKLGRTEYHYFDYSNEIERRKFFSKVRLNEDLINRIINDLALFDCIDKELWQQGIIFSEKFVESVADAYKDRILKPFYKKEIIKLLIEKKRLPNISREKNEVSSTGNTSKETNQDVSCPGNPQSKLKETKGNEIKLKETSSNDEIVEPEKTEEDVFFNKFLLSLKKVKAYPYDESAEKILWEELLKLQQNKEKLLHLVGQWVLNVLTENPLENDPRFRLSRWVETRSADDIKEQKKAQATAEAQTKEAEETAILAAVPTHEEEIVTKEKAIEYLRRFKPHFWGASEFGRSLIKKFGLIKTEVWG